ncbi:hypothetical protein, partial [Flavobacterium sp. YO12]|uniref:hypothetical protein n=1 Tax=Flavobacterium sp. YO12 TaxID=1920029 RepID=UPI001026459F
MKLNFFSLLSLTIILLNLSACSSEDSPKSDQSETIDPATQNLVSITFPTSSNMAYMTDKQEFKYDDKRRINLIGNYYAITYVNDDLIETKNLGDNVSNSNIENKTSIILKNKNISLVISNTVFKRTTGEVYSIERDSTVYTYDNEY